MRESGSQFRSVTVLLAAADVPRGSLRPARVGLIALSHGEVEAAIEWPGASPRSARKMSRGRIVFAAGTGADVQAVALWLRSGARSGARSGSGRGAPAGRGRTLARGSPAGPEAVLPLDLLLRRAGRVVPRRRDISEDDTPLERCRRAAPLLRDLTARPEAEGIRGWRDVPRWLAERPDFDFSGRQFDRAFLAALPGGPGVYRFFDARGELVYVGQSRGLRTRVSSYFRLGLPPSDRQAKIAARTTRIEVVTEGSDLAAQVREASEIRRLRPSINRQRAVRERQPVLPWTGDRVIFLPAGRGRVRDVFFVRDGEVLDRRRMEAGTFSARRRAEVLLRRYFFSPATQPALPGILRKPEPLRSRISRRSAAEASHLLATWTRRRGERVLSFDPLEAAGAGDAIRRLLAYLEADPAGEIIFIR